MSRPLVHLARVTFELSSPLSVGNGVGRISDIELVRDGNGLPMILGSSLQGLLRTLFARSQSDEDVRTLFGDGEQAGRVVVGPACIHDSRDVAVVELRNLSAIMDDDLLRNLLPIDPLVRDHVRLGVDGTAEDAGKFDRSAVPRGARFSFELMTVGDEKQAKVLETVAQLAWHPLFRPGGATRRGYGKVVVMRAALRSFHASDGADARSLRTIREQPPSTADSDWIALEAQSFDDVEVIAFELKARGPWRVGRDGLPLGTSKRSEEKGSVDLAFTREPRIVWHAKAGNDFGVWEGVETNCNNLVLAGSAIRGALAHRALFHANKSAKRWISFDSDGNPALPDAAAFRDDGLEQLFGVMKSDGGGRRSPLIVEDVGVEAINVQIMDHAPLDRATGGVIDGLLFAEERVFTSVFEVRMILDTSVQLDGAAMAALNAAVEDLKSGRLSLGAKSSGWFEVVP